MTKQMQNAVNQIFENKELSKKLIKLETLGEIFELFKSIDSEISKKDFEEGVNELLEKSGEKLPDESLSKVSGGVINENLRKPLAATLAALSLGITPIKAAPKAEIKPSKTISNGLWAALGITSAAALGTAFYILLNTNENSPETKLKKFYYETLKSLGNDQLLETCKKFQHILKKDEITALMFEEFFMKNNIHPENLSLEQIKDLLFNKEFFKLIPLYALNHIFPEEIETKLQKILENKNGSFQTQEAPTSFVKGMPNIGNSCHLNVILQLLRQIPEAKNGNLEETESNKIKHLNSLMKIINVSRNTILDDDLKNELQNFIHMLYPGQNNVQQDASETLMNLELPCDSLGLSIITAGDLNEGPKRAEEDALILHGAPIEDAKYKIFCTPTKESKNFSKTYSSNGKDYELKCIVCHHSNHYYAYLKSNKGKWCISSDESSKPIDEEFIFSNENIKTTAVMLLYSKKN